jgi:hypothetical protein
MYNLVTEGIVQIVQTVQSLHSVQAVFQPIPIVPANQQNV